MNTLSTITIMPSTKDQLIDFVSQAKNEILNGEIDPIKIFRQLKFAEKAIQDLLKDQDLENYFLEEAEKYGKRFELFGSSFEIKDVGVSYDYSGCGDYEYNKITKEMDLIKKRITEREKFLKSLPDAGMVNPDTGEIIYRPARSSKEKVTIKL